MSDDLFYTALLVGGAWALISSFWMLDHLIRKWWSWRQKMEDDPHVWIAEYLNRFEWRKGQRLRIMELEKEHLAKLKFFFADFIVDHLFLMQMNGEKTAEEVTKEIDRLGNLFDMPDLLPRNQEALKETIRQRLQDKERYKPVPFPKESKDIFNKAKIDPNPLARRQTKWLTSLRSLSRTKVSTRRTPSSG